MRRCIYYIGKCLIFSCDILNLVFNFLEMVFFNFSRAIFNKFINPKLYLLFVIRSKTDCILVLQCDILFQLKLQQSVLSLFVVVKSDFLSFFRVFPLEDHVRPFRKLIPVGNGRTNVFLLLWTFHASSYVSLSLNTFLRTQILINVSYLSSIIAENDLITFPHSIN